MVPRRNETVISIEKKSNGTPKKKTTSYFLPNRIQSEELIGF